MEPEIFLKPALIELICISHICTKCPWGPCYAYPTVQCSFTSDIADQLDIQVSKRGGYTHNYVHANCLSEKK